MEGTKCTACGGNLQRTINQCFMHEGWFCEECVGCDKHGDASMESVRRAAKVASGELETIICAAVRFDGKVWRGHRHPHAMAAMHDALSWTMTRKQMTEARVDRDQGFITSRNRYVDRKEAMLIQLAAGIPSADSEDGKYGHEELFSEDLY